VREKKSMMPLLRTGLALNCDAYFAPRIAGLT